MDIDKSKENIQPLRGGRNVMHLSTALQAQSDGDAHKQLALQKAEYEARIQSYVGPDPLDVWFTYIQWLEQCFPKHGHEGNIDKALKTCLTEFENDPRYIQDKRFIRLWIKYIDYQNNPLELYQLLYNKGVGTSCSELYRAWACYCEEANDCGKADQVYNLGLQAQAQPMDELLQAHKNFQLWFAQRYFHDDSPTKRKAASALAETRLALTSLRTIKRRNIAVAPTQRTGDNVKSLNPGVVRSHQPGGSNNQPHNNIMVDICRDAPGPSGVRTAPVAVPQSEGTVPQSILLTCEQEDNIKEVGMWTNPLSKSGKLGTTSRPIVSSTAQFEIYQEDGIKLHNNHVPYCVEDLSDFKVPLTLPEPDDPTKVRKYNKKEVYRDGEDGSVEFSLEEIRATKYLAAYKKVRPQTVSSVANNLDNNFVQNLQNSNSIKNNSNPHCGTTINNIENNGYIQNNQYLPIKPEKSSSEPNYDIPVSSEFNLENIIAQSNSILNAEDPHQSVVLEQNEGYTVEYIDMCKNQYEGVVKNANIENDVPSSFSNEQNDPQYGTKKGIYADFNRSLLANVHDDSMTVHTREANREVNNAFARPVAGIADESVTSLIVPAVTPFQFNICEDQSVVVPQQKTGAQGADPKANTANNFANYRGVGLQEQQPPPKINFDETCSTQMFNFNVHQSSTPIGNQFKKPYTVDPSKTINVKKFNISDADSLPAHSEVNGPFGKVKENHADMQFSENNGLSTIMETTEQRSSGSSSSGSYQTTRNTMFGNTARESCGQSLGVINEESSHMDGYHNHQQNALDHNMYNRRMQQNRSQPGQNAAAPNYNTPVGNKSHTSQSYHAIDHPYHKTPTTNYNGYIAQRTTQSFQQPHHQQTSTLYQQQSNSYQQTNNSYQQANGAYSQQTNSGYSQSSTVSAPHQQTNMSFHQQPNTSYQQQQQPNSSYQQSQQQPNSSYLQQSSASYQQQQPQQQNSYHQQSNSSYQHQHNTYQQQNYQNQHMNYQSPSYNQHQQTSYNFGYHQQQPQPMQSPQAAGFQSPSNSIPPGFQSPQQPLQSPQQGFTSPQQGFTSPQQGFQSPQHGFSSPQQGFTSPQHGYASPQQPYASYHTPHAPQHVYAARPQHHPGYGNSHVNQGNFQSPPHAVQGYSSPQYQTSPQQAYNNSHMMHNSFHQPVANHNASVAERSHYQSKQTSYHNQSQSIPGNQPYQLQNNYQSQAKPQQNTNVYNSSYSQMQSQSFPSNNYKYQQRSTNAPQNQYPNSNHVQQDYTSSPIPSSQGQHTPTPVSTTDHPSADTPPINQYNHLYNNTSQQKPGFPPSQALANNKIGPKPPYQSPTSKLRSVRHEVPHTTPKVTQNNTSPAANPGFSNQFLNFISARNEPKDNANTPKFGHSPNISQKMHKNLYVSSPEQGQVPPNTDLNASEISKQNSVRSSTANHNNISNQSILDKQKDQSKRQLDFENKTEIQNEDSRDIVSKSSRKSTNNSRPSTQSMGTDNYQMDVDSESSMDCNTMTFKSNTSNTQLSTQDIPKPADIDFPKVIDPFNRELNNSLMQYVKFPNKNHYKGYYDVKSIPKLGLNTIITLAESNYSIEKQLGKGTFGSVYRALDCMNKTSVAIKYQKPGNPWEYYICKEIRARIQDDHMLLGYMDIQTAFFSEHASIFVSELSRYGSLLDVANKVKQATAKCINELIVMLLASEMLSIVHYLHKAEIIHADIKPDNFLLMEIPQMDSRHPSLQLIDLGCAIDMSLYPEGTTFKKVIMTEGFTCNEMREGKSWTYQTDLYCLAGTIFLVLMGKYMQTFDCGGRWNVEKKWPRYMKAAIWDKLFLTLLNIKDCNSIPDLMELKAMLDEHLRNENDSMLNNKLKTLSTVLKSR